MREVLSDCALPISVLLFSFIGSYVFSDIERQYHSLLRCVDCTTKPGENVKMSGFSAAAAAAVHRPGFRIPDINTRTQGFVPVNFVWMINFIDEGLKLGLQMKVADECQSLEGEFKHGSLNSN